LMSGSMLTCFHFGSKGIMLEFWLGFHGETDWVLFLVESLGFRWMMFMD
jgi:hypothetical protein